MKRITIFFIILVIIVGVTGCSKRKTEPVPDNTHIPDNTYISDTETPYRLYDEDGEDFVYLSEDNPEVIRIREFVQEFVSVMNTMDYRTLATEKAYPYLTQSLLQFTKEDKTWESMANSAKELEIVSEAKGVEIETALIEYDFNTVYILYTSVITILEANEAKLAETQMVPGDNLERAGVHLVKENDQWKVDGFGKLD
jgi:hypothetical protein